MEIDCSAANTFRECALKYKYIYEEEGTGLEPKVNLNEVTPLSLGSRIHELLEEYYQEMKGTPIPPYPVSENAALEIEAEMILSAYKAKYPGEEFKITDVERTFKVELPVNIGGYESKYRHIYTGKIDLVFRQNGTLSILDHKSEKRRSNSNHVKRWAAKDQASLYLWAASKIYHEEIGGFYVNILKRPSDKLQEGPIFPERQRLERTSAQIEIALRDLSIVADQIEQYRTIFKDTLWPSNKENCFNGYYECPFYLPDTFGWSQEIREQKYQPKTPYLKLGNVDIIQ